MPAIHLAPLGRVLGAPSCRFTASRSSAAACPGAPGLSFRSTIKAESRGLEASVGARSAGRGAVAITAKKDGKKKEKREKKAGAAAAKADKYPTGTVIIVDNYDSFTYNLSQYLGDLKTDHIVIKNDELTVEEVKALKPRGILVSPGPGTPEDSGISLEVVKVLGPTGIPVFGVCMGHQCIGQVFGGNIIRAPCGLMHGKTSPVFHNDSSLLEGLPSPFTAARYHSLVIEQDTFPDEELEITAWTEDGTVMGVRHKKYPAIQGVQFHPESIITDNGHDIVANFVKTLA